MHQKRKKKLIIIVIVVLGLSISSALVLSALRKNIDLYYTPQQVLKDHLKPGRVFRLGGVVKKGSIIKDKRTLSIRFTLTDFNKQLWVNYTGVLPVLFREGQGIVADGYLVSANEYHATQLLAKHDEHYKPPLIYQPKPQKAVIQ